MNYNKKNNNKYHKYNNYNNRNNNYKKHYQYYKKKKNNHNNKVNNHNAIDKKEDLVIEEQSLINNSNDVEFDNSINDNIVLNEDNKIIDNNDIVSNITSNNEDDMTFEEPILIKKDNHLVINNDINKVEEKVTKRKPIFRYILGPLLILLALIGATYAYFTYYQEATSQGDIIAGEVYIKLKENPALVLTLNNLYPRTDEEARARSDNYVDFTILGKNTSTNMDLGYKFKISLNEVPSGKISIDPENLKFDVYSLDSENNETPLLSGVSYNKVNEPIQGLVVSRNTLTEISRKYRIRVWMKDTIIISDTEPNRTYTQEEFNKLMANISVNVMNSELEGGTSTTPTPTPANVGTIPSCPGCKFIYTTNTIWTSWNTNSETSYVDPSTLSESYLDVVESSGKNYFLGLVTNGSNEVTNAYACGVKNDVPFCIEGYSDNSKYTGNKTLINGTSLWNNTCTEDTSDPYTTCGDWNGTSLSADAYSHGLVDVGPVYGYRCVVDSLGNAFCTEGGDA